MNIDNDTAIVTILDDECKLSLHFLQCLQCMYVVCMKCEAIWTPWEPLTLYTKLSSPTNVILSTLFIILFFVAIIVLTANCIIWWKKEKSKESLSPTTLMEELDIKTFSELDTKTVSSDMTQSGNMKFEMTNYACEELDELPLLFEDQEPVN